MCVELDQGALYCFYELLNRRELEISTQFERLLQNYCFKILARDIRVFTNS